MEGQDQTEDVGTAMDASQSDRQWEGCGRLELGQLEMILPVLVAQLELGRAQFLQEAFLPMESGFSLQIERTAVIITLIDGAVRALLPAIESPLTVGTPVDGFWGSIARGEGRQSGADFAADLSGLTAVVEVEVVGGSPAVAATTALRDLSLAPSLDRSERLALLFLIGRQELFPIPGRQLGDRLRRLAERSPWINIEVTIVGMLLPESVSGFDFRFSFGKDLLELPDDFFEFLTGEILAEPENKSCYFRHGGVSRFLSPFDYQREETKPPLSLGISCKTAPPASPSTGFLVSAGGESTQNRGEDRQIHYYYCDVNKLAA